MSDAGSDRFGMPPEALEAARKAHGPNNPMTRLGMYVPTRREVAVMEATRLLEVLDLWFWESPTELIPSREQVSEVRTVVASRPDADTRPVREILSLCDDYLAGDS